MPRQFWMEVVHWATADGTAVHTTVTETIIFPNYVVPGNFMQDGRQLIVEAWGRYSTTTGPPTLRFRLRWGGVSGTVLADSGTITTVASTTNAMWFMRIRIQTRLNGATGSLFAIGDVTLYSATAPTVGSATGAGATAPMGSAGITAPAAATVDLTADTALSSTVTWSASSATNTLTGHNYFVDNPN